MAAEMPPGIACHPAPLPYRAAFINVNYNLTAMIQLLPYSESSLSSFPSQGLGSLGVEDDLWRLPPDEKPSTNPSAKSPMT